MNRVVIIGSGYAGIKVARELTDREDIQITILDKHPYHNLQPEVYDFIANKSNSADVTIDLITLFQTYQYKIRYYNARVEKVDFENKKVITEEKEFFDYDYLVISAGARTIFPEAIKGLNHSEDIKKLHKALGFKQRFELEIFKKIDNEAKKCEETHIVIIGAGLSGVEIAAEMAYYSNKFFEKGHFACENLKISLISSKDTILPKQKKFLINKSTARLRDLGVDIIVKKRVEKLDKEFVYLNDGSKIRYSFAIYAGGIEGANIVNRLDRIEKNSRGQIIINKDCQVKGLEGVFACGDVAEIRNSDGSIAPPSVPTAEQSAKSVAKNIKNLIDKKPLVKCNIKHPGVLIALGGKYAVARIGKNFMVSGFIAFIIKKVALLKYKLPLTYISKKGYEK